MNLRYGNKKLLYKSGRYSSIIICWWANSEFQSIGIDRTQTHPRNSQEDLTKAPNAIFSGADVERTKVILNLRGHLGLTCIIQNTKGIAELDPEKNVAIFDSRREVRLCWGGQSCGESQTKGGYWYVRKTLGNRLFAIFKSLYPNFVIKNYNADRGNKSELSDVAKYWKCDILIYNTVACTGVYFNIKWFDIGIIIGPTSN